MKKKLSLLLTLVMVIALLPVFKPAEASAASDVKFVNAFFPGGKVNAPTNPYAWFIYAEDHQYPADWETQDLSLCVDQPEDIRNFAEIHEESFNATGNEDTFNEKYDVCGATYYVQVDMRVDGGDWQYTKGWDDETEFPEAIEGLDFYNSFGGGILEAGYYISGNIACADFFEGGAWDLAEHTYEFRARFHVVYNQFIGNNGEEDEYEMRFLNSDWSKTTSIGKDGKQKRVTRPKSLPTPQITFLQKYTEEGKWKGKFMFDVIYDQTVNDYEKYMNFETNDGFEALGYYMEAAVNDLSESDFHEITESACRSPLFTSTRLSGGFDDESAEKIDSNCRILVREFIYLFEPFETSVKSEYAYLVPQVSGIKVKTQDTKSITLTWNAVKDASFYEIFDGNNKLIGTSKTNTYKAEGLKPATGYDFKIRAVVGDNYVGLLSKVFKAPTAPEAPVLSKVTSTKKAYIQPTWEKVSAGTGYQVQTATNAKFTKGKKAKKITKLSTLTKSLKRSSGKKLYVRVRSYYTYGGKTAYSDWSNSMNIKVK